MECPYQRFGCRTGLVPKNFPKEFVLCGIGFLIKIFIHNGMISTWNTDGVKAMIYINPYFANLTDSSIKRNLFLEGDSKGYFIKNSTG
jgi:alpha-glucosidase (family GH31 glycosyl hydrolase)